MVVVVHPQHSCDRPENSCGLTEVTPGRGRSDVTLGPALAGNVQIPVRFTHPNTAAICQCKTQPQHGEGIHLPGCAAEDMDQ